MPLEGRAAPSPWWWWWLVAWVVVDGLMTSQAHRTVRSTSIGNPVPGNQEFCLVSSKTMVEQVKNEKSHLEHGLRMKTL